MTIVINPIDTQFISISTFYSPFGKLNKGIIPFFTDFNPPSAIGMIIGVIRTFTAMSHLTPDMIKTGICTTSDSDRDFSIFAKIVSHTHIITRVGSKF